MSDDIFEKLAEQVKESNKRWKEIEEVSGELKKLVASKLHNEKESYVDRSLICTTAILTLLLVDQLRPMNSTEDQVVKLQSEIQTVFDNFIGKEIK